MYTIIKKKNQLITLVSITTGLFLSLCVLACQDPGGGAEDTFAADPFIISQPQDAVYAQRKTPRPLTVQAESLDEGTLSYQWYAHTEKKNQEGTLIPAATSPEYTPSTDEIGTFFYYAAVTNTNPAATGEKTARIVSDPAKITVNSLVNADPPVITSQPQAAVYTLNDKTIVPLRVTVALPADGGTLSYQWYRNAVNSNETGTLMPGLTDPSYTPPVNAAGTVYYYVVVTNKIIDNYDGGTKTAEAKSSIAAVTVNSPAEAQPPVITSHPQAATYTLNEANVVPLKVEAAAAADGGTLS